MYMWELARKEEWAPKNLFFWTVVLEKTLESPLDCRETKPVNPKRNQSWIGRTDAEADTLIPWPPDAKSWLIGKDPDAGKDWRQEEKGMTEDGITDSMDMGLGSWWWTGRPGMLQFMGLQSWTWLSDWTELKETTCFTIFLKIVLLAFFKAVPLHMFYWLRKKQQLL